MDEHLEIIEIDEQNHFSSSSKAHSDHENLIPRLETARMNHDRFTDSSSAHVIDTIQVAGGFQSQERHHPLSENLKTKFLDTLLSGHTVTSVAGNNHSQPFHDVKPLWADQSQNVVIISSDLRKDPLDIHACFQSPSSKSNCLKCSSMICDTNNIIDLTTSYQIKEKAVPVKENDFKVKCLDKRSKVLWTDGKMHLLYSNKHKIPCDHDDVIPPKTSKLTHNLLVSSSSTPAINNLKIANVSQCQGKYIPEDVDMKTQFPNSLLDIHTVTSAVENRCNITTIHDIIPPQADQTVYCISQNVDFTDSSINKNPLKIQAYLDRPSCSQPKETDLFDKVLEMFPDIDRNYLKNILKKDAEETIELILSMNNNYPKVKQVKKQTDVCLAVSDNISKLDFLMEIFPDADRTFMEERSTLQEDDLKSFISESMEKDNYKKSVKTGTKLEENGPNEDFYKEYFVIEHYLKLIPDPFLFFSDEKRICKQNKYCIEFLKERYKQHTVKTIDLIYKKCSFNLTRTCEMLDVQKPCRSTKRSRQEIHMPQENNLEFLKEVCFISHKGEIKSYLDGLEEVKKLAYQEAEARGELIECGCCYENLLFEDCASCNEGDLFCKKCIKKGAELRIGEGLVSFPCLLDCGASFSLHLLQNLLEPKVFSRLVQRIQLDEVKSADIEGLEICPFCEFATIPPSDTNIFSCLNPECLKESCRKCHRESHIPLRCEEVENDDQLKARKYIEDQMTKALVRECYRCKKTFIKMDGCNKMTCPCGAKMCYICRKPVTDYSHFNSPGSVESNKCPLYSTDKVLHVDAVKAIAKKAKSEMTENNPTLQLKFDPTSVLPSEDGVKTSLPRGVIEQPAQLVIDLQRIQAELEHPVVQQVIHHNQRHNIGQLNLIFNP